MFKRIIGVFLLREPVFEEIGTSKDATWQAALIVLLVALSVAISAAVTAAILGLGSGTINTLLGVTEGLTDSSLFRLPSFNPLTAFFTNFIGVFTSWILWALVTFLFGNYVFKGDTTFTEMLRIIGFAEAPRLLSLLGIVPIPFAGLLFGLVGWVWAIIAAFVGIRQGLELDNGKTILTIVASLIVIFFTNRLLVNPIVESIFG